MECYCYRSSDGKTPHERRLGMPFDGPVIPFGAMVEYHPISSKEQKSCQVYFSVMHYSRRESGKETLWS